MDDHDRKLRIRFVQRTWKLGRRFIIRAVSDFVDPESLPFHLRKVGETHNVKGMMNRVRASDFGPKNLYTVSPQALIWPQIFQKKSCAKFTAGDDALVSSITTT